MIEWAVPGSLQPPCVPTVRHIHVCLSMWRQNGATETQSTQKNIHKEDITSEKKGREKLESRAGQWTETGPHHYLC